jgi:hypothetical protein
LRSRDPRLPWDEGGHTGLREFGFIRTPAFFLKALLFFLVDAEAVLEAFEQTSVDLANAGF